jgi:hypothetical protein
MMQEIKYTEVKNKHGDVLIHDAREHMCAVAAKKWLVEK